MRRVLSSSKGPKVSTAASRRVRNVPSGSLSCNQSWRAVYARSSLMSTVFRSVTALVKSGSLAAGPAACRLSTLSFKYAFWS